MLYYIAISRTKNWKEHLLPPPLGYLPSLLYHFECISLLVCCKKLLRPTPVFSCCIGLIKYTYMCYVVNKINFQDWHLGKIFAHLFFFFEYDDIIYLNCYIEVPVYDLINRGHLSLSFLLRCLVFEIANVSSKFYCAIRGVWEQCPQHHRITNKWKVSKGLIFGFVTSASVPPLDLRYHRLRQLLMGHIRSSMNQIWMVEMKMIIFMFVLRSLRVC